MYSQYYKLPDHLRVVDAEKGIVECQTEPLSEAIQQNIRALCQTLAESFDVHSDFVNDRIFGALAELELWTAFKDSQICSPEGATY